MNVFRVMRLPDLFTLLNVIFGFLALLAAGGAWGGNSSHLAVVFILLAAAADGLDGFVARKTGSSPLGANLDSLADLISFGTAPVYLAIMAFHLGPLIWPAGIFYLICGTLRLARFNVAGKGDQFFEGLPIPAAGIFLSASVLLGRPNLTILLMLILAGLMVSSISYPKIRDIRAMAFVWTHISCCRMVHIPPERYSLCSPSGDPGDHALYLTSPVVISRLQKRK